MDRLRVRGVAARAFARLPEGAKRIVVRMVTPAHTLGSLAVLRAGDRVLVLKQDHSHGWQLPGGLLERGETAVAGLRRELVEELGAGAWSAATAAVPAVPAAVLHDPVARRVDFVFAWAVTDVVMVPGAGIDAVRWLGSAEHPGNDTTAEALRAVGFGVA